MKNVMMVLLGIVSLLSSCKKDEKSSTTNIPPTPDNYFSLADFFIKNAVPTQSFTVNSTLGGTFTATKGTQIVIPPNAFMTDTFGAVTGNVEVTFREVYTKSEMFFANVNTGTSNNSDMFISGGMFYFNSIQNGDFLRVSVANPVVVKQPFTSSKAPQDALMRPYILTDDPFIPLAYEWTLADDTMSMGGQAAGLLITSTHYIYTLYQSIGGTWSNTDDPNFFFNFNRVGVHFQCTQPVDSFNTDLYVIFKSQNTVIHIYRWALDEFDYPLAPDGLECTAVAVGIKDGKLYSAFVPLTVSNNLSVNISLSETTTDEFKGRLKDLD